MVSPWICWLVGVWISDRGSTARGVVSIKNKDPGVLAGFIVVSTVHLGVTADKMRTRTTKGYSTAYEIYFTSKRIRDMLEYLAENRASLTDECARAYLAGRVDGDGYVDHVKREIYIGCSTKYINELMLDKVVAENVGIETPITRSGKVAKLRLKNPVRVARLIQPYVLHSVKRLKILHLLRYT